MVRRAARGSIEESEDRKGDRRDGPAGDREAGPLDDLAAEVRPRDVLEEPTVRDLVPSLARFAKVAKPVVCGVGGGMSVVVIVVRFVRRRHGSAFVAAAATGSQSTDLHRS